MDGWMDEWMDGWVDGWIDGCIGGWVDGWVGGWMHGWLDGVSVGGWNTLNVQHKGFQGGVLPLLSLSPLPLQVLVTLYVKQGH